MRFHGRIFLCLVAITMLALVGCTRQVEEKSSVSLSLPSFKGAGAMSTAGHILGILIVNVQGPGIGAPIYRMLEHKCMHNEHDPQCVDMLTAPGLPNPVQIPDVPNGTNRLVQLMAVFVEPTTKAMKFYYGDALVALNGGTVPVNITVNQVGNGSGKESRLAGRFLNSSLQGVTGRMLGKFVPPLPDRPPMTIIEDEFMFGGWFNAFAIEGADFEYFIEPNGAAPIRFGKLKYLNGQILLDGAPVAMSDHVMGVRIPSHFRQRWSSGNIVSWQSEPSGEIYVGYFGTIPSLARVCYSPGPTPIPGMALTATGTGVVNWASSGGAATDIIRVGGGVTGSPCISGSDWVDKIPFRPAIIGSQGVHDGVGFQGPFVVNSSGSGYNSISATLSGTTVTASWTLLPGVFSGVSPIEGIEIFYKELGTSTSGGTHIRQCFSSMPGYTSAGVTTSNSITFSVSSGNTSGHILACPYRTGLLGKVYLGSPAQTFYNSGGGGGAVLGGAPDHIELVGPTNTTINPNACVEVKVVIEDSANQPATLSAFRSVTLSGGGPIYYFDPTCTTSPQSGPVLNFNAGSYPEQKIFVKNAPSLAFTINASSTGLAADSLALNTASGPTAVDHMAIVGETTLYSDQCREFYIQLQDSANALTVNPNGGSTAYNVSAPGVVFYSSHMDCETEGATVNQFTLFPGTSRSVVYARSIAGGTSPLLSIGFASGDESNNFGNLTATANLTVMGAGAPAGLRISTQPTGVAASCQSIQVEVVDANGNRTRNHSGVSIDMSDDSSGVFYPATCGTAPGTTMTIPASQYKVNMQWKSGSKIGDIEITAVSGAMTKTHTVWVNPAYIKIKLPGENYVPGSSTFSGSPNPLNTMGIGPYQFTTGAFEILILDNEFQLITNTDLLSSCNYNFAGGGVSGNGSCNAPLSGGTIQCPASQANVDQSSGSGAMLYPNCTMTPMNGTWPGPTSSSPFNFGP